MMEAPRQLRFPHSPSASLFYFGTPDELRANDPLLHHWLEGSGREVRLI
jgi:hypothetical protein